SANWESTGALPLRPTFSNSSGWALMWWGVQSSSSSAIRHRTHAEGLRSCASLGLHFLSCCAAFFYSSLLCWHVDSNSRQSSGNGPPRRASGRPRWLNGLGGNEPFVEIAVSTRPSG